MNYVIITVIIMIIVLLLLQAWALAENSKRRDQDTRQAWRDHVEQSLGTPPE